MQVVGHNRYWAVDTDYARQNGGDYDFILEPLNDKAIPVQQEFWDFLMKSSKEWHVLPEHIHELRFFLRSERLLLLVGDCLSTNKIGCTTNGKG